jgi:sterol desaturase/sphingolipid hydroxylase (fatty acid hydroxylase superfamily)
MESSTSGAITTPARIRRDIEARKARHRLYPVSVLYTAYALAVMAYALRSRHLLAALGFFAAGVASWTYVEYLVHRYILHGRFADGPGYFRHFLHKYFDHLHWEHHKRPWDGNHINGTIEDTLPFLAPVALLFLLAPVYSLSAFLAGFIQAYIIEEWVHHSVHFCQFKGSYFQYIKRHHLYHHSPKGSEVAFGLTNGFWDIACETRIPSAIRQALYAPLRSERAPRLQP